MRWLQCFLLFAFLSTATAYNYSSVLYTQGSYSVVPGKVSSAVAWGYFSDETALNGWGKLSISTSNQFSDNVQCYAAGFLEGYFTHRQIYQVKISYDYSNFKSSDPPKAMLDFIRHNDDWVRAQVQKFSTDSYWQNVGFILSQLDGLVAGYNKFTSDSALTEMDFLLLNMAGDIEDLSNIFSNVSWQDMTPQEFISTWIQNSRCSALIKLTADFTELYTGHTTWSGFEFMLRIFKSYNFALQSTSSVSKKIVFSAYPGTLSSIDDFYVTDRKLAVLETTNGIYNTSVYRYVTAENSVMSWIRTMVSNRMADSGEQWTKYFAMYNSGTYNNQWMVVDYKLFTPGRILPPNVLWIIEQMPGYTQAEDVTTYLALGYWPSYNMPFFEKVYTMSGFDEMVAKYGDWFTYELHPRAKIFRRDHYKVVNTESMKAMMRYNDWEEDPFSLGNAGNAISSRFDLVTNNNSSNPFLLKACFGGIDSKITSNQMIQDVICAGSCGPTHDDQTPFRWSTSSWPNTPHFGQPDTFDFPWEIMIFD
eukprot:TRINITY_DN607_c0_g1_i1.p1 TRINITY_DN607_c0_g1~~TRINITY_DN607_c0_g1_i1.p1  ORF type:complete len:533 (-),score=75.69 TRINITY_DN607_c0_g1_i1:57-1655(-)